MTAREMFEVLFWFRYPDGRITCVDVNADGGMERYLQLQKLYPENGSSLISLAKVGAFTVSTIFLTTDHNYVPYPRLHPYHPIVFESAVFAAGSLSPSVARRARTEPEALANHAELVRMLERGSLNFASDGEGDE